jgi:hypothetical protein
MLDPATAEHFATTEPHGGVVSAPGDWPIARATVFWLRGDSARLRVVADTARMVALADLRRTPGVSARTANLALADAYLGHRDAALREIAEAATEVEEGHALRAFSVQYTLATIRLILGDKQGALDALITAMHMPVRNISPTEVRIDPTWTALRPLPAFQRLVAEDKPIA